MADYYQLKNQNIFNPPANTDMGNANSQFNTMYVQNALVLGNVSVTGTTIIAPRVSSIAYPGNDTAADTAGGQTITLNGTGFVAGASVLINGSAVGVVSVVSSTVITFTSPANTTGSYVVYVINPDGSTAIAIPGIQYSGTPSWTTAAGTLGNVYETASFTQTVTATGDAPITYSVASGSIPPGATFNANGTITGTSQLSSSPTTYSFTVRATDAEQQDTDRAFSIAVIPDVITWSSPTDNATYSPAANIAIANITLSATSAVGSGITYSANTLPTGLSLTGANISGTPTVVANTSSLLTATANTTSESSSITINWVVSVASDPYFMYNTLLLPGNGTNGAQNNTFLDGSTNNFAITRNGNTTQGTFSPYGPNWSNYFGGASNYLTVPYSASLAFGTGDFCVEFWLYWTGGANENNVIMNNASGGLNIKLSATNAANWALENSYVGQVADFGTAPTKNTWHHIAVTRSSGTLYAFIDGTQVFSGANSTNFTNTNTWYIGANGYSVSTFYIIGNLSNFRIVVGSAVYTSNFTPSTTPLTAISGTSLLTCADNRFIDDSTNAFAITVNGNTNIQRFSPFSPTAAYSTSTIGGSGYFDGTGDYLSAPSNAAFAFGTGDFTFECWVYTSSATNQMIFDTVQPNQSGGGTNRFFVYISTTQTVISGPATNTQTSSNTIKLGAWNHIVVVRSASTRTTYINGVSGGSAAYTSDLSSTYATIGLDAAASGTLIMNGYISNLRVVKGTAVYTSAFTPPTAPVTAISGTSLLLNYTNAGIIDNTMINNLETIGNAQISTAQSKFGGGSMYFDGTGDYLAVQPNITNNLGTGDFTIEAWVYLTSGSTYQFLIGSSDNASGFMMVGLNVPLSPTSTIALGKSGQTWPVQFGAGTTITSNTWTHIAITRSGTTNRAFINGVQLGSNVTDSTSWTFPSNIMWIGNQSGGTALNGYIDDFRITKGYARYTTTFTPPTSAFPTY
jgi:hypothetical protein